MGLIVSRFRRKKTTTEVLERLETDIKKLELDGAHKTASHKRVTGYMMAYSVGIYVLFVLYYYMYAGRGRGYLHSIAHASPLLLLPVLVIFLRAAISRYFNWTLTKNRLKLNRLRDEKKKILEEVMNTETYKVAKEILDKYGSPDDQCKALKPYVPSTNVPGNAPSSPAPVPATPGQLRQRQLAIQNTSTPINKNNMNIVSFNVTHGMKGQRLPSEQLPRPLLEQNRSALDKVVDYILKDGPNYRMALICSQCNSHNGMALFEEFEFVSYDCAYCGKHNPARKQRPRAPPLTASPQRPAITAMGNDDSSIASSNSESEEENKSGGSKIGSDSDRPPSPKDRPPSPIEATPKSQQEKKED